MDLRPYQKDAINAVVGDLVAHDRIYIKLATGSGKTFITVSLIEMLRESHPNLKTIFVVPKNILVKQSESAFKNNKDVGVYNAGIGRYELDKPITIASYQSLVRAKKMPHCNLLIFDECHRAKKTHEKLFAKLLEVNPKIKLMGLTATDYDIYDELFPHKSFSISAKKLTDLGFLAPIVTTEGAGKLDLTGVKIQAGDYNLKQLGEKFTPEKIDEQVSDMIERSVNRKKVIILTTSIEHAEKVYKKLPYNETSIIHSKQKRHQNDHQLEKFKSHGKYLVSVLIASEGFDFPPADCLALMRPTRSPTLYEQAVGRIARLSDGKVNGLFLDYGNIIENLGFFYDIKKLKRGEVVHKDCNKCQAANPLAAKNCEQCGTRFMSKCKKCGNLYPFGEPCCKREVDLIKNTTNKAYDGSSKWKPVATMEVVPWVSKNGRECVRVNYMRDIFKSWASEYFGAWNRRDFNQWLEAHAINYKSSVDPSDFIRSLKNPELKRRMDFRQPDYILVGVNDSGYKTVKSRSFGEQRPMSF